MSTENSNKRDAPDDDTVPAKRIKSDVDGKIIHRVVVSKNLVPAKIERNFFSKISLKCKIIA